MECPLFIGLTDDQIENIIKCFKGVVKRYEKDEYIVSSGDFVKNLYVVSSGEVDVESYDYDGFTCLAVHLTKGGIFGGAFAFSGDKCTQNVRAVSSVEMLVLPCDRLLTPCNNTCYYHTKLVENLVKILAKKSSEYLTQIGHISARTIRAKVLSYLSTQSALNEKKVFDIPFSRKQLADYLCVDRVALSKELSLMQKDKLIVYRKNHFEIL